MLVRISLRISFRISLEFHFLHLDLVCILLDLYLGMHFFLFLFFSSHEHIDYCYCCCQSLSHFQLCDPMDCSMPGFPVLQHLSEHARIHVHWIRNDILKEINPTILSSVTPFSCLQSFPESGSFLMSEFFTSGGQSMRVSASASVLPMNIQDWFPLQLTGLISLQSKGLSRVFSNTTDQKHQFFGAQPFLWSNSHIHTRLLEKP